MKRRYEKIGIIIFFIALIIYGIIIIHKNYIHEITINMNSNQEKNGTIYKKNRIKKNKVVKFKNKQFECSAMFGFEGVIYKDLTYPVEVVVKNNGNLLKGTMCIIVPEKEGKKGISIVKDISLEKNQTKKINFDVPRITTSNRCKIVILDREKILLEKEIKNQFQYDDQGSIFFGVLSKNSNKFNYIDQMILAPEYDSMLRKITLTIDTFPSELDVIKHFHYLLIDHIQYKKLSEEQKSCFLQWIEQGGIVICYNKQDYDTLKLMLNADKIKRKENIDIELDKIQVVVEGYEYELGAFYILPQKISKMNKNINEKSEIIQEIFREINNQRYDVINKGNRFSGIGYMIESALDFHYDIKLPKTKTYFLILIIYIICISPIGYFVLKRIDRREWIGFWIIGFAALFHSTILFISSNSSLKEPVGTMISIVDGSKNKWNETLYTSWINPTRYPYSIKFTGDNQYIYPYYNDYYNNVENVRLENIRYFMKKAKNETHIVFGESNIFERELFILEKQKNKTGKAFVSELQVTKDGIIGTVTNNTGDNLWDSGILYYDFYVHLGEFKSGETKKINLTWNHKVGEEENDIGEFMASFLSDSQKKDIQILRRIEDLYYFFKTKFVELKFDEGIIFGISDQYEDMDKIYTTVKKKGKTLYYTRFSKYMESDEGYIIPNIMLLQTKDIDVSKFNLYDNSYYGQDDSLTFKLMDNFTAQMLSSNISTNQLEDTQELSIYAWNYQEKEYEQILKDNTVIEEKELKKYIQDNQIILRFLSNGQGAKMPKISVIGGGLDARDKTID